MSKKFFFHRENIPPVSLTCVNDMDIDVLGVAGGGVALVDPAVHLAGVTDNQAGGGPVSSEYVMLRLLLLGKVFIIDFSKTPSLALSQQL